MTTSSQTPKIAFLFDDRLPHDRKNVFMRTATILKSKFNFEMLPAQITESELIEHFAKEEYTLILLPWYRYLSWKKVEGYFGALRLQGPTVAGYFADAVLPFELTQIPNFHRLILLDFYRLDQPEIEMVISAISETEKKPGFAGLFPRNTPVYQAEWFEYDQSSTRCIDHIFNTPTLKAAHWTSRIQSIRFFMTALWSLCFQDRHSFPTATACASLEIAEANKRLAIKLVFESSDLTLKRMMDYLWPNSDHVKSLSVQSLVRHCDFLRVYHYPESHHIEITAFFTPAAPCETYPGEVRGFWIEPLKAKFLKSSDDQFFKCAPVPTSGKERVGDQIHEVLETLRAVHLHLGNTSFEERIMLEKQVSHLRFLIQSIEKKVAEKKKVA